MYSLWPRGIQVPPELKLDILNQMARHFDLSHVGWVPLWPDVVMLQDARGIEVMDEWLRG